MPSPTPRRTFSALDDVASVRAAAPVLTDAWVLARVKRQPAKFAFGLDGVPLTAWQAQGIMTDIDRRLWPYKPRASLFSAAVILPGLLLLVAILRATSAWPSAESESAVLIGVVLLSLLPIVLALLDVIIERGAVIEYAGIKVNFSQRSNAFRARRIPVFSCRAWCRD